MFFLYLPLFPFTSLFHVSLYFPYAMPVMREYIELGQILGETEFLVQSGALKRLNNFSKPQARNQITHTSHAL